jgi:hypothetical protein
MYEVMYGTPRSKSHVRPSFLMYEKGQTCWSTSCTGSCTHSHPHPHVQLPPPLRGGVSVHGLVSTLNLTGVQRARQALAEARSKETG